MNLKDVVFKNLKGREVKPNSYKVEKLQLTAIEIGLIQRKIDNYKKGDSFLVEVSKRLHLDFIGWDNPEYNDVLVCLTNKKIKTK